MGNTNKMLKQHQFRQDVYKYINKRDWACCSFWNRPCPHCVTSIEILYNLIDTLNKTITQNPRIAMGYQAKAVILANLAVKDVNSPFTQLISDALECMNETERVGHILSSENVESAAIKAEFLFLLEYYEEALDLLQALVDVGHNESLHSLIMTLYALERYDEALELCKTPFDSNSHPIEPKKLPHLGESVILTELGNEDFYGIESVILTGLGQYDKFIEEFEGKKNQELNEFGQFKYLKISDYYHMGKAFEKSRNKKMALEHYNGALKINSSYPPAIRARNELLNQVSY